MTTSGADAMRFVTSHFPGSSRAIMVASAVMSHVVSPEQPTNA